MPETTYLHSLAYLTTLAEVPVPDVQRILDQIGAKPSLVLNLCAYYGGDVAGAVIARARGWSDQPAYHRTFHDEAQEA